MGKRVISEEKDQSEGQHKEDLRELTTLESIGPSPYRNMRDWYLHELAWVDDDTFGPRHR